MKVDFGEAVKINRVAMEGRQDIHYLVVKMTASTPHMKMKR